MPRPPTQLAALPAQVSRYPRLRYMGNKHRLLPWIHSVLSGLEFQTALDAFSGSGCVSYLLKAMGKAVTTNDFLDFARHLAVAGVENSTTLLSSDDVQLLVSGEPARSFVEDTYSGIFYTPPDLRFLDVVWTNMQRLPTDHHRSLAIASLTRACLKRQPRGVFTFSDPTKYDDGRRDLRLSLREHFAESVAVHNATVFDTGHSHTALRGDVFDGPTHHDLVYLDPPYVPRSDDNCYVKRYHFLEGLASYWTAPNTEIMANTKTRKLKKRHTPFSYRRQAADAFDRLFTKFADSTLVLSYSSNGFPDLDVLTEIMGRAKASVEVHERDYTYQVGTRKEVSKTRTRVQEYLIVGR